ncbi:MAG TPA: hypothetical protein VHI93_00835, partial [Candidatus Thermoplasmatota archaeon]|nr:hypothetical protein [Candidatus Thermoplasmatota archaeon]
EVLRRHPSPLGWLPRYGVALLPALWGAALWALFHAAFWQDSAGLRRVVVGSPFAAHLDALAGLLLGGWLLARLRGRRVFLHVAAALAAAASLGTLLGGLPEREALPLLVAAGSLPLLAWAELARLGTHHHATTLRLVVRTTFPRRTEQAARHAELSDIDVRQGVLGRLLDTGTLLPLAAPPAPRPLRLVGVRPLRRVLRLVEVLVRQATATDYLRERQGLERQHAEALAALQRR